MTNDSNNEIQLRLQKFVNVVVYIFRFIKNIKKKVAKLPVFYK